LDDYQDLGMNDEVNRLGLEMTPPIAAVIDVPQAYETAGLLAARAALRRGGMARAGAAADLQRLGGKMAGPC
jgi:hypothetical protein